MVDEWWMSSFSSYVVDFFGEPFLLHHVLFWTRRSLPQGRHLRRIGYAWWTSCSTTELNEVGRGCSKTILRGGTRKNGLVKVKYLICLQVEEKGWE